MLYNHKCKFSICYGKHSKTLYAWSQFFILLPQVAHFFAAPFSFAFFTASHAAKYSRCCVNRLSHNCWWYSVFSFPPPFVDDMLAPGDGKRPCLIVGLSVIAVMSDQLNFWSSFSQLQPCIVSTLSCCHSHDTHSTTTAPDASVSSSSSSDISTKFFLPFFEFILTFGLGPGFVFLRLVIAAALPSGPAADLLFTMMNKQRNFGIGVARGLLSGHCTDEAGYIKFI